MLENVLPSLREELNINSYVNRFQTLLYLEKMECFVNLRMYDREWAHFTREGKYLALVMEKLSERPSLAVGDIRIVKAKSPWANDENAEP
ncbi:putative RNA helicase armi isoform 2-T2 [Glossina fuscipes fuscipes]